VLSSLKKMVPSLIDQTIDPIIRDGYGGTIQGIMKSLKPETRGKQPVMEEEMWAMVDAPKGDEAKEVMGRGFLLLSWYSAVRLNELRNLRVRDMKWSKRGVVLSLRKTKAQNAETVAIEFKPNANHCPLAALRAWLAMCERATPESDVLKEVNAKTGVIQEAVKDFTAYPKQGADVVELPVAARVPTLSQRKGFATR
jgi:integrase